MKEPGWISDSGGSNGLPSRVVVREAESGFAARRARLQAQLGEGVAIPHGKLIGLDRLVASFARSSEGVDFDSIDGQPTHHFFLLVVPEHSGGQYLKALARISRFFRDPAFRQRLDEVDTLEEVIRAIEEEDAKL